MANVQLNKGVISVVVTQPLCGPGSSVGIAIDYGLNGTGIESRWGEIFRPSRPTLGPTQPPVQWIPDLSWGKKGPEREADPSPPSRTVVVKG